MSQHHVEHAGERIDFTLTRSRRRSIAIRVEPDGAVTVRAPLRAPIRTITRAVAGRVGWIATTRERLVPFRDDVRYASGATHHLKGVPYELQVREAAVATVATEGTTLIVSVPAEADAGAVRLTLEAWYLDRAREHLPLRLAACWGVFEPGLPDPPSLRIRMMRSRWGSLSPAGAVTLNGYLMRAPSECIDAVIFHELCHLRVRGHGPDFYAELARYVPEWSRLRVELRGYRP